jgi:carboxyl-terminal processing protease
MYRQHTCFRRVFLLFAFCLAAGQSILVDRGFAQELPATPAAKRAIELLECINNEDADARKPFLTNGFSDEGDLQSSLEQRCEIASTMHQRFAPFKVVEVLESGERSIVVKCSTSTEAMMRIEVEVSKTDPYKITDVGMGTIDSEEAESVPPGMVLLFGEDGKSVKEARGIWKAKGYGYLFEVKEDSFDFYNVTKSFAWKDSFDAELFFKANDDGTAVVTMHALEPGYNLVRLEELPPQCNQQMDWKPPQVFDAFVDIFRTHYPFFKKRNVDWEARAVKIRPTISDKTTDAELFEAMEGMLDNLGDGHVIVEAEVDGKDRRIRSDRPNTLSRLRESFEPGEKFKTRQSYTRDWRDRFKASILEQTLHGKGVEAANNQIFWGRADDRIGYIAIFGMGGYSYGNTDDQVESLHEALNEILAALSDTDALILDISFNGGGSDLFSLEIASHFTDQKRLGFSKWPATEKQYRQDRYVTPYTEKDSEGTMYLKPVWLVTNDITASAAEIFTMCMRSMPQVRTIGLHTEGALSDILQKTLPNGWDLGLSNEIYTDHEGKCHEGPGVPPQIEMDIFNKDEVSKIGHAESMKKIVQIILNELEK